MTSKLLRQGLTLIILLFLLSGCASYRIIRTITEEEVKTSSVVDFSNQTLDLYEGERIQLVVPSSNPKVTTASIVFDISSTQNISINPDWYLTPLKEGTVTFNARLKGTSENIAVFKLKITKINSTQDFSRQNHTSKSIAEILNAIIRREQHLKVTALYLEENFLDSIPPEITNFRSLKVLNLTSNNIQEIPRDIGNLEKLEYLYLSKNNISRLPLEIGSFTSLIDLQIRDNPIVILPVTLSQLKELRWLEAGNKIRTIPVELGALPKLQFLNLSGNDIEVIPKALGNSPSLEWLYLANNNIKTIPSELGSITTLKSLNLASNNIVELPSEIGNLSALEFMYLDQNKLVRLPLEIGSLSNLKALQLDKNSLTQLPSSISSLTNLKWLHLSENSLFRLHSVVGALVNLESLYLNQNRLQDLPHELTTLPKLTLLDARSNPLGTEAKTLLQSLDSRVTVRQP